jgi:hypothetical protein
MPDPFDIGPEEMEVCEGYRCPGMNTAACEIYRCVRCDSTYCKYDHLEISILLKPASDSTGIATAGHNNLHIDLTKGDPTGYPTRRSPSVFSDSYMGS